MLSSRNETSMDPHSVSSSDSEGSVGSRMYRRTSRPSVLSETTLPTAIAMTSSITAGTNSPADDRRHPVRRKSSRLRLKRRAKTYLSVFITAALLLFGMNYNLQNTNLNHMEDRTMLSHSRVYEQVRRVALENGLFPNQMASHEEEAHKSSSGSKDWPDYGQNQKRPQHVLGSTYGTHIDKCELTVFFMDPRISEESYGPGEASWYALESVGAFASSACVLLLTSHCHKEEAHHVVRDRVYRHALPLFRDMMDQGRVRLTFLDHVKYGLKSCLDYGNPSSTLIHHGFWKDEFIDGVDSETVLYIQDDAVLCRPLDVAQFEKFAYVGSVWPRHANSMVPFPPQGMCDFMPSLWESWTRPQRQHLRQGQKGSLPTKFPANFCEQGIAPVGNGGLSIRNRKWLRKAIETCPHIEYSGLNGSHISHADCKVVEFINEDTYFGVVFRGMGAPLPNALEASLFSSELMWPERAMKEFPFSYNAKLVAQMKKAPKIKTKDKVVLTVPFGLHKPWYYSPNSLLLSSVMDQQCPFVKFIFHPNMTNWKDISKDSKTGGIVGT